MLLAVFYSFIHSFIYQFPIIAAAAATDWVEWDSTIVYSTEKRNELWLLAIVCITMIVIIEVNILIYTNMRDNSSNQLLLNIISTHLFRFQHRNPKIFAAAVIFMLLRSTLHIYLHINYSIYSRTANFLEKDMNTALRRVQNTKTVLKQINEAQMEHQWNVMRVNKHANYRILFRKLWLVKSISIWILLSPTRLMVGICLISSFRTLNMSVW